MFPEVPYSHPKESMSCRSMATFSLDWRERIGSAHDQDEGTRDEIAQRFRVPLGMVKKLLQQRRKTGCIKARHHLAGRKKLIVA